MLKELDVKRSKNLSIITVNKTYDSVEVGKIMKTSKYEISGKAPFVSKFILIREKTK